MFWLGNEKITFLVRTLKDLIPNDSSDMIININNNHIYFIQVIINPVPRLGPVKDPYSNQSIFEDPLNSYQVSPCHILITSFHVFWLAGFLLHNKFGQSSLTAV